MNTQHSVSLRTHRVLCCCRTQLLLLGRNRSGQSLAKLCAPSVSNTTLMSVFFFAVLVWLLRSVFFYDGRPGAGWCCSTVPYELYETHPSAGGAAATKNTVADYTHSSSRAPAIYNSNVYVPAMRRRSGSSRQTA